MINLRLAVLGVALPCLVRLGTVALAGPGTPAVRLYVPAATASAGEAFDVVVEVTAPSDQPMDRPALGGVERRRATGPGIEKPVVRTRLTSVPGPVLIVRVEAPPTAQQQLQPPVAVTPASGEPVPAGGMMLVKLSLPAGSLAQGECQIVAALVNGQNTQAESQPIAIHVEPARQDATDDRRRQE